MESLRKLSIGLIEDNSSTADYLIEILNSSNAVDIAFWTGTLADGIRAIREIPVDVLLTDLGLPDGDGIVAIEEALRVNPECQVLVVSAFGDDDNVIGAIRAGAGGYLLKGEGVENIDVYIEQLVNGGSPISPRIAKRLIAAFRVGSNVPSAGAGMHDLTTREVNILNLLAVGYSYVDISADEGISINTVRHHIKNIYSKLYVCSKTQAVYEAQRRGLINLGFSKK